MIHEDFMKYEEKKGHGTYLLPFASYGTIIPDNLTFFPAHWHDEMEIIFVKQGRCTYYINFKPYEACEGDIIIVPPTIIHSFEQYKTEGFAGFSLVFSLNMVNNSTVDACSVKYFMPIFNNEIILQIHIKSEDEHGKEIRSVIKKILNAYYGKKSCYELKLKIYLMELFTYLFQHELYEEFGKKSSFIKLSDNTKIVITYIEEHYSEKISLKNLAELTNQSLYNFAHSFKHCTGQSPLEYINQYRLSIAAKQLETTDNAIINIAIDNGFNNVSYFNRAFKAKFCMTPTQYRKQGRG